MECAPSGRPGVVDDDDDLAALLTEGTIRSLVTAFRLNDLAIRSLAAPAL
jgi:hypothetical protein